MEDFDLSKSFDELLKPTDPPKEAALKNTTVFLVVVQFETQSAFSSISRRRSSSRLPWNAHSYGPEATPQS